MRAILIPADTDEPLEEITLASDTPTTLISDIKGKLSDYFEVVRTRPLNALMGDSTKSWTRYPAVVMLVDEDGLQKRLPFNPRASCFYDGRIVGTAILMTEIRVEGSGDLTDLDSRVTIDVVNQAIAKFNEPIPSAADTVGQDVEPR